MIKIGDYNEMRIMRFMDFGAYLSDINGDDKSEVLLPRRYVDEDMCVGDTLKVFVYTDSEDRPVATLEQPYARVGEFAFLQTIQVNRVGAFLDWGLQKNLLVPFKEQKIKMFPGGIYLVYIYLDNNSQRVVASARVEKFLGNVFPEYKKNDEVDALIIGRTSAGYQAIVDNLHRGMIYENETYQPLEIGRHVRAFVKQVREEDGKIDLTVNNPDTLNRIEHIASIIMDTLQRDTSIVNEKASSESIKDTFKCSKKDFKKAVGMLYREHKVIVDDKGIVQLNTDTHRQ